MSKQMKMLLKTLFALLVMGGAWLGWLWWAGDNHRVVLVNDTGRELEDVTIAVRDETYRVETVQAHEARELRFRMSGEGSYAVTAVAAGARVSFGECGYTNATFRTTGEAHVILLSRDDTARCFYLRDRPARRAASD